MFKKTPSLPVALCSLLGVFCLAPTSVSGTDFYLRPTSLSMVEDWTPAMSFFVSNPSDRTIVLRVDTRERGPVLASETAEEIALTALPAEIVLKAGDRRIIRLDYIPDRIAGSKHFEVIVEQLPIIYLKPGEDTLPETMLITRYVADVEVRPRISKSLYAMTGFGRAFETNRPSMASAP